MNELKVTTNEKNEQVISGRELHDYLEVGTQYTKWFDRMAEYGFTENIDYVLVSQKRLTNNPKNPETILTDHLLKLSMAKELCMLARSEKGKQARLYFIQCEEEWNKPEAVFARALVLANQTLARIGESNRRLLIENQTMKPKADYFDELVDRRSNTNFRDTAKMLGVKEKWFIERLILGGFVYRDAKNRLKPYAAYVAGKKPYFEIKESKSDVSKWAGQQTLITPYGRQAFEMLFVEAV